jgi:hypothetical protein
LALPTREASWNDEGKFLKRVFQAIAAWFAKRFTRGFQEGRPRADISAPPTRGPATNSEPWEIARVSSDHTQECPVKIAIPEILTSRPVDISKFGPPEQREPTGQKEAADEMSTAIKEGVSAETEQVAAPSNQQPVASHESSSADTVIVRQQPFPETEISEGKTATDGNQSCCEPAAEVEVSELLPLNMRPANECAQNVAESKVKDESLTHPEKKIDKAPPTEKTAELIDETKNSERSEGEAIVATASALGAMAGRKAASSELEWDESSEKPETGPNKQPPVKSKKIAKDAGAPPQKGEATSESDSDDGELQKTPPIPVDISPYEGVDLPALPDSYLYWNRILLERFVTVAAGGQILLATSPRALAAALFDDKDERVLAADAQQQFARAVALAYRIGVVGSRARLRFFRRHDCAARIPACVGFLALSVLAAHKMHTDETTWGSDYYARLSGLLGVERAGNGLPVDFRGDEFESLWLFMADWISKQTGWSLVLPQGNIHKRFIAYPLAHVPLRQLDIEKLPTFFESAGYSSEMPPTLERMEDDLGRWNQAYGSFSSAGCDAFNDGRKAAVLAQVRSELRAWDGLVSNSEGKRSAQVEILLETVGRRSKVSLLAPRREGFPETFSAGPVQMTGGESWYDPMELKPEDGALLKDGFLWASENQQECILRRPPGNVFVLAPNSEYSGMVSRIELPKGVVCAVLCHESVATTVGLYLATICESTPRPFRENTMPDGWLLFPRVRAIRRSDNVPTDFRALDVASEINIVPVGGLRVGTHWTWMQGEAPRLLVEGHDGQALFVNDTSIDLDEEGYVNANDIFAEAGIYRVRVGSFEKKVRIIQPSIRPSALPVDSVAADNKRQHSVILEVGQWVLIGSYPGTIDTVEVRGVRSAVIFCNFKPTWAIKLGARRPETRVIKLANEPVALAGAIKLLDSTRRWASAICAGASRRPVLEDAENRKVLADEYWNEYVRAARAIKRLWKSRHR